MNCMLVLVVFASIAVSETANRYWHHLTTMFAVGSCDAVTWKNYKGKGYALIYAKLDWISAQRSCIRLGGILAHAETPEVNNFLISMTDRRTWLWLGGSNIYDTSTWEWQNPLKPIRHDYWAPGQRGQPGENCMQYWKSYYGYKWGSYRCHLKLGFLCQRNINDGGKNKGHSNHGSCGGCYSKLFIKRCMATCLK